MKNIKDCAVEELKEAIWHYNNCREPGGGPYAYEMHELRVELYDRTGECLGNHEKQYENENDKCECHKCELSFKCVYRDRFQRHSRINGGLGLCPKLQKERYK